MARKFRRSRDAVFKSATTMNRLYQFAAYLDVSLLQKTYSGMNKVPKPVGLAELKELLNAKAYPSYFSYAQLITV